MKIFQPFNTVGRLTKTDRKRNPASASSVSASDRLWPTIASPSCAARQLGLGGEGVNSPKRKGCCPTGGFGLPHVRCPWNTEGKRQFPNDQFIPDRPPIQITNQLQEPGVHPKHQLRVARTWSSMKQHQRFARAKPKAC